MINLILISLILIVLIPSCIAIKIQEFKAKQSRKVYHRANGQFKRQIPVNFMGETIAQILL